MYKQLMKLAMSRFLAGTLTMTFVIYNDNLPEYFSIRATLVERCGLFRRGSWEDFARATELSSSSLLICWSS